MAPKEVLILQNYFQLGGKEWRWIQFEKKILGYNN